MYIYLGTYYHTRHKGTISVIDENGSYVTLEKKIGKTVDLEQRETALNRTKSPIGYTFLRAWRTGDDTDRVELAIHALLDNVRSEGEWFADDDDTLTERLTDFMIKMRYPEVALDDEDEELVSTIERSSAISAKTIDTVRNLKNTYPDLFTNSGQNYVSNNSHALNICLDPKTKGYNLGVHSPNYKKYPCTEDHEFQKAFTDFVTQFDLKPKFNAKAGYVTQIATEEQALEIFRAAIEAVKNKTLTIG
jgi:Meiotically up-regulated gene 113